MKHHLMHPCDLIVMYMKRVYFYGMTTTSGGNISLLDEQRSMWITPAAVDKAKLRAEDIVRVRADGTVTGLHRPSSEFPFHQAIYAARPDVGAVIHAHPSALVAFSIVRERPDTNILAQAADICGQVGFAPYATPGSAELGENIARAFAEGHDSVLLENHGVVCAGRTMEEAYQRFETLDFCARLIIKARMIGPYQVLTPDQIQMFRRHRPELPEFTPEQHTNKEKKLRKFIREIVHRAYDQQIMTSTEGVVSARVGPDAFLITPTGQDRKYLTEEDLVLVSGGQRENGKLPSRSTLLHKRVYERHPETKAICSAQGPSVTAFAVTEGPFDTRTIPESYAMLREAPKFPYGAQFSENDTLAEALSAECPAVLLENDATLVTGGSLLEAYDRLEVAEFTAQSLLNALPLGQLISMGDEQISLLRESHLFRR